MVYSGDKFKVDLFAEFSGEISYTNLALSERAKTHIYLLDKNGKPYSPAWTTLNIRSSYMLSEKQTLFFGIDNLLDRRYRPYSSGIVASGINLSFALSTNF